MEEIKEMIGSANNSLSKAMELMERHEWGSAKELTTQLTSVNLEIIKGLLTNNTLNELLIQRLLEIFESNNKEIIEVLKSRSELERQLGKVCEELSEVQKQGAKILKWKIKEDV